MPAIVTTPVNVAGNSIVTPSVPIVVSTFVRIPVTPVVAPVGITGVKHFVNLPPLRRWNGSAWVPVYVPRF